MEKCKLDIKGMHCRSCEILIEDELTKINGIKKAVVDHKNGTAEIFYSGRFNKESVKKAIENAGYSLGKEKLQFISLDYYDYLELGVIFIILMLLYLIAKNLGLFNLTNSISSNYSNLSVVLLIGLTAGVSSCMALVGGLVLGASARFAEKHPSATGLEKFKPHLYFNLGRIASYFVLGGIIGLVGSFFQLSTSILGIMTIAVGMVMFVLGGQLVEIFPILKRISFTIPKSLTRTFGIKDRAEMEYSNKNASIMGALTFFLPCGFTQAMQLYAISTGNPVSGALTMGVFAIGTAPGLLSVGGLTSVVKGEGARYFFKTVGIIVIFLALFNLSNGLNLLGINLQIPFVFGSNTNNNSEPSDENVKTVNGVQEVRMTQDASGYTPNNFIIKKGIPVKWIITSQDSNTCAASIVSQQLGIRQSLQPGENIIQFTPSETGIIRFSCIMGMYTGSFNVTDGSSGRAENNTLVAQNTTSNSQATQQSCGSSGGCGCGGAQKPIDSNSLKTGDVIDQGNIQLIKAVYTTTSDISPNKFSVKINKPVQFDIDAKDNGSGCMGSIAVPGLTKKIEVLTKNQTTTFNFTPTKTGVFNITCAMGIPRGQIEVD